MIEIDPAGIEGHWRVGGADTALDAILTLSGGAVLHDTNVVGVYFIAGTVLRISTRKGVGDRCESAVEYMLELPGPVAVSTVRNLLSTHLVRPGRLEGRAMRVESRSTDGDSGFGQPCSFYKIDAAGF